LIDYALGTGNPNPDPNHSGPSIAIVVNETPYIIDFGPGLIRQASALTPQYGGDIKALGPENIRFGFLTHLHSDHTIGYPDIILTPWVMERSEPLTVFGPKGTKEMTEHILKAYNIDIEYRLGGKEPINPFGYQVNVHEIEEGIIFTDENIQVEAFRVLHGILPNAFGFRFTTRDKVIVISGDTAPCRGIKEYSRGTDILIHEVYSYQGYQNKKPVWQAYHRSHHTSTRQLANLAKSVKPGLLVTYHTLFWGYSPKAILEEIREIYDGKVVVGTDLLVID
jgi:ribonuclease Z